VHRSGRNATDDGGSQDFCEDRRIYIRHGSGEQRVDDQTVMSQGRVTNERPVDGSGEKRQSHPESTGTTEEEPTGPYRSGR